MSFHPRGSETSSTWFHGDDWLDFNMHQTGHGLAEKSTPWARIAADYERTPVKPVLDGEPLYEDHPLAFASKVNGYSFDAHIRQRAYWDVFSGACGHTYGNHSVWQMYAPGRQPINGPLLHWYEAIHRPGAAQMQYVRTLIESRPYLSRVPDTSIVANPLDGADRIVATRGDGYVFVYSAQGRPFTVNMGKVSGEKVKAWWYNPRTGTNREIALYENTGTREFVCPSEGFGSDWVLVLDDAARNFPAPGLVSCQDNPGDRPRDWLATYFHHGWLRRTDAALAVGGDGGSRQQRHGAQGRDRQAQPHAGHAGRAPGIEQVLQRRLRVSQRVCLHDHTNPAVGFLGREQRAGNHPEREQHQHHDRVKALGRLHVPGDQESHQREGERDQEHHAHRLEQGERRRAARRSAARRP